MNHIKYDPGSFRDPKGFILDYDDRILRLVTKEGAAGYEYVRDSGFYDQLVSENLLLKYQEINPDTISGDIPADVVYLIEHPKLKFISYPYEWPFSMLKAAALMQLEVYLKALEKGITLTDASAYNIQFNGTNPVFIDHLSFRKYNSGEFWLGHRQFCEQFLNPLLLSSVCGVSYNSWYRGNLEGIGTEDLNKIIPFIKKFSPGIFFHITLQSFFQKKQGKSDEIKIHSSKLPVSSFKNLLENLKSWIKKLKSHEFLSSNWAEYTKCNTYTLEEENKKHNFIRSYVENAKPKVIWDIGCNTGEYSNTALKSGVEYAIGFDSDQGALNAGYNRAQQEELSFLPLYMDLANPSPSQGWASIERQGLDKRSKPDGVIALALLHHLIIARNIPIEKAINWIINIAPTGVIEFIPKQDKMVQILLRLREDIFDNYSKETFLYYINRVSNIIKMEKITDSGRILIWYETNKY